ASSCGAAARLRLLHKSWSWSRGPALVKNGPGRRQRPGLSSQRHHRYLRGLSRPGPGLALGAGGTVIPRFAAAAVVVVTLATSDWRGTLITTLPPASTPLPPLPAAPPVPPSPPWPSALPVHSQVTPLPPLPPCCPGPPWPPLPPCPPGPDCE